MRMLCPNCNSQQKTFAGRNKKKILDPRRICECGKAKSRFARRCMGCAVKMPTYFVGSHGPRLNCRKVKDRPLLDVLQRQVDEDGYSATGRRYGVSDNAVRKWLKYG
jgi:hypothetical protein